MLILAAAISRPPTVYVVLPALFLCAILFLLTAAVVFLRPPGQLERNGAKNEGVRMGFISL